MASSIVEQDDLVLALLADVPNASPLAAFMQRLLTKTQARRGLLLLSSASETLGENPEALQFSSPRAKDDRPLDISLLMTLDLHPLGSLRPGRVYAVDEMLDYDRPTVLARQRETLAAMGIRYGRWLRIVADEGTEAWILLIRESEDFSSAAVATISSVVPYLRAALRLISAFGEERLHRFMAQSALERLGIGQLVFDENATVLAADAVAESALTLVQGRGGQRLQLSPSVDEALVRTCQELAILCDPHAQPVCLPLGEDLALLLGPPPSEAPTRAAALATLRLSRREEEASGARCLRALHQLSPNEAALAEKLSRGMTIAEAGRDLQLTEETARNYSKRIYARAGARGHADLVRIVLGGLAPLA